MASAESTQTLTVVPVPSSLGLPKVVVCGKAFAGKTTLLIQLIEQRFEPTLNVGHSVAVKKYKYNAQMIDIWDVAGQMRAAFANKTNFRDATAVIIVGAVDQEESIEEMLTWMSETRLVDPMVPIVAIFNKIDVIPPEVLEGRKAELRAWAEANGMPTVYFTSAKDHDLVVETFEAIFKPVVGSFVAQAPKVAPPQPRKTKPVTKKKCDC